MARRLAAGAEVARRRDQPAAEVPRPDAVHEHPGGERVRRPREPVRQFQPAAAGAGRDRVAAEDFEEPPRHLGAELVRLASLLNPGVRRHALAHAVGHVVGHPRRGRLALLRRGGQVGVELGEPVLQVRRRGRGRDRRAAGRRERRLAEGEVVEIVNGRAAGDVAVPVADERVEDAVPPRAGRLAAELGQVAGAADAPGVGLRRRVDVELERVPRPRFERPHDLPLRAVADGERGVGQAALHGERCGHPAAEEEPVGALLRRRGDGAEVDGDVHPPPGRRPQPALEHVAHAVAGRTRADPDAAGAGRVDVDERALGVGPRLRRPGREPRAAERLPDRLRLQPEVDPAGERGERRPLPLDPPQLAVEAGQLRGLRRVAPRGLVGRDERGEVRRPLVLLAAGERPPRALEDAVQAVVVGHRHRVVLVVVAAGAAERQAEHRPADRLDGVGEVEVLVVGGRVVPVPLADREEPGRGDAGGVPLGRAGAGQDVAGDLLADELVEWLVGVERGDHPVAVAVRLADRVVGPVAGGVGVPGHVEPVPAPPLAVGGRREEPVHHRRVGAGRVVRQERGDLGRRRREPGQVERGAAEQRPPVGGRGRLELLRLQSGEDETVEVGPRPGGVGDGRGRRVGDRAEGPVVAAGGGDRRGAGGARVFGPRGAVRDPLGQRGDLRGCELALRRHPQLAGVADGGEERPPVGLPGHDRRAALPALQQRGAGIDPQARFLLLRAVAPLALGHQHRPNVRLEERDRLRRRVGGRGVRRPQGEDRQRPRPGRGQESEVSHAGVGRRGGRIQLQCVRDPGGRQPGTHPAARFGWASRTSVAFSSPERKSDY